MTITITIAALVAALAATPVSANPYGLCDLGETHYRIDTGAWIACDSADQATVAAFQGEGLLARGQDIERSRPFLVAAATFEPLKAYYTCEAGLGLLDPAAEANPCRPVAGVFTPAVTLFPCADGITPVATNGEHPC